MNSNSTVKLNTGNRIPIIGLGTWKLTNDTPRAVAAALQMGYPMIDTSGDYGTQPGIAEGIKMSGKKREDFYIVTKIEETEDAYRSTLKNLRELQLDYVDLMLIHRPPATDAGEDLWFGLIQAREDELIKDIGVSNYSEDQIRALIDDSGVTPVVNQIEWSAFGWSEDMKEFCDEHEIIIQAYSPITRTERLHDSRLEQIAKRYNKTSAQILLRWCLQNGTVPLPKANQEAHMRENLRIFDFSISEEDMNELNNLEENYSALGAEPIYLQQ